MFYKEKDLVVSPTRHPKPVSQVAENLTVITAREIEAMNAHTVAEVLNRVTGLFVNFNQDFGAASLLQVQSSEERHVLVLVDKIPWNFLSGGNAETNSIPVGIIDRIEIVKGPVSSAWGSSLGGVVNIITKPAGNTPRPSGSVSASYGERKTQDYRAELFGAAGPVGYYLFAGHQDSDGLRASRDFDNDSLYSKFRTAIGRNVNLGLTMGYARPRNDFGELPTDDLQSDADNRTFFVTGSMDAKLNRNLRFALNFHSFKQKFVRNDDFLSQEERLLKTTFDEDTLGGSAKLVWTPSQHTVILGTDYDHGELDQTLQAGQLLQAWGAPETTRTDPRIDKWAVYANDTIALGNWSITPGIRYDDNNITGSFLSPSLGITFKAGEDSILRASVSRGFTIPPLTTLSGGSLFLDPNPSLDPEEVWSYQAGVETSAARYLWVKATLFRHDVNDVLRRQSPASDQSPTNDQVINNGDITRQGIELEVETASLYNLSLLGGFAYVDLDPPNEVGSDEIYAYNIGIRYDDKKSLRAELFGHYVWWDLDSRFQARYDDFIWDLNLNKKIVHTEKTASELFFTVHNIFNGSQYTNGDCKNPRRWAEAGIRFKF